MSPMYVLVISYAEYDDLQDPGLRGFILRTNDEDTVKDVIVKQYDSVITDSIHFYNKGSHLAGSFVTVEPFDDDSGHCDVHRIFEVQRATVMP